MRKKVGGSVPFLPRCTRAQKEGTTINPIDFFFVLHVQPTTARHTGMSSNCTRKLPEMMGVKEMCQSVQKAAEDGTLELDFKKYKAIGKGKYGGVYLNNEDKRQPCVAKVQKDGAEFRNEVSIMMGLKDCDFVPRYYYHFSCKGVGYIIMEALEKPGDEEVTTEKVRDLLQRMYNTGWFHLDNHKGNVMKRPGTNQLILIDFGLSLPHSRTVKNAKKFMHSSSASWEANFAPYRKFYLWSYQIHLLHYHFPGPLLSPIQGGPYTTSKYNRHYTKISAELMNKSPKLLPQFTPQRVLYWVWDDKRENVKQTRVTQRAGKKRLMQMQKRVQQTYFMVHPVYEFVALRGPSIDHKIPNHEYLEKNDQGVYDFRSEDAMVNAMSRVVGYNIELPSILEGEIQFLKAQNQQRKENKKPNPKPRQDPTKALGLKVGPARPINKQNTQQLVKQRRQQKKERVNRTFNLRRIDN